MSRRLGSVLLMLLAVVGGFITPLRGQERAQGKANSPHLTVSLLAEPKVLRPGATLWLGLRFQPEPGWHIYWQNPGDSGEPARVAWRLPAGITAGSIEWPTPERLGKSSIVDYGYSGDTMLLTRLRVDGKFHADDTRPSVGATVRWVVCSDICIPGKATLNVPLGVTADASMAAQNKLFADAVRRLPRQLPRNWRAAVVDEGRSFELTVVTGKPEPRAAFFPFTPEQVENGASQKVTTLPNGVKLTLAKSDGLLKPISVLRGVIVLGDGIGYEVTAPVKAARSAESKREKTP
jgi:thiol:disulfide interchange protein DsbD